MIKVHYGCGLWCKWKELEELKNIGEIIIVQITMMFMLINIKLNVEHH